MLLDMFSALDYCFSNWQLFKMMSISWMSVIMVSMLLVHGLFFSSHKVLNFIFFQGAWMEKKKSLMLVFLILSVIFSLLFFQKILGLFPYTFSMTSHMVYKFFLALEIWFLMIFYGLFKKTISFFGHFTPLGSPLILSKFLNLMEVVSVGMRSLTLSLRLAVKISTGHMFLGLVSSWLLICSSYIVLSFSFLCFVGYFFFELFVCFIQALVFSLLLVQYLDEK